MPIFEYRCVECRAVTSAIVMPGDTDGPRCKSCGGERLDKLISAPGLVRSQGGAPTGGQLRAVDPRRTVEQMSRSYDAAGIDPGGGFDQVARRAAAGDSPHELKQAVREAKKNLAPQGGGDSV